MHLTSVVGEVSWKDHESVRRAYCRRLRAKYGDGLVGVWTREPHPKSGFPHMHCILFWLIEPPAMAEFRKFNDDAWAKSVGKSVEKVRRAGCQVERVRSSGGAAVYCSMYVSKKCPDGAVRLEDECGRSWGKINARATPRSEDSCVLSAVVGKKFVRACRKLSERKRRRWQVWALGSDGHRWFNIRRKIEDGVPVQVEDQVLRYQELGIRVRLRKRRAVRRRIVNSEGRSEFLCARLGTKAVIRAALPVVRKMEQRFIESGGFRVESVCHSVHLVRAEDLLNLRDFLLRSGMIEAARIGRTMPPP